MMKVNKILEFAVWEKPEERIKKNQTIEIEGVVEDSIKPCKKCKTKHPRHIRAFTSDEYHYYICNNPKCKQKGRNGDDEEEARKYWNTDN